MEVLLKLESADTLASRSVASEIHRRLKGTRDPLLLGELVDFYFETYSKRTRKILTTLGEAHSQDYFDKLCECLLSQKILPVFKLLAHTLNSQHANWLYRIVDHTLFACILKQLEESDDVIVLAMGLLVVATILPMVPTYIGSYLQQLFSIFCNLATIRSTNRLGLTPHELVLHLDVSVYYFFLQLYALFPLNLFSFFKSYCQNSTRAQVNAFQEFVTPLFYQVQLHPGLVVDSCRDELSKAKWGALEPSDIATLCLQFCIDKLLSPSCEDSAAEERDAIYNAWRCPTWTALEHQTLPSNHSPSLIIPPPAFEKCQSVGVTNPVAPPPHSLTLKISKSDTALQKSPSTCPLDMLTSDSTSYPALLTGPLNPSGFKTDEELCKFWSPSVSLGQISSRSGFHMSDSQRSQQLHLPSLHLQKPYSSAISSPNSDSARSSTLQTPSVVLTGGHSSSNTTNSVPPIFTFKNYSPTASVDGESLFGRQIMSQSAIHTPSALEESFNSRQQFDPLFTQSLCVGTVSAKSKTPYRSVKKGSFRNRLGSFFGSMFKKELELENDRLDTDDNEDFVEVFINNHSHRGLGEEASVVSPCDDRGDGRISEKSQKKEAEEVDLACGRDSNRTHSSSSVQNSGEVVTSGCSDSPVDSHRGSGFDGVRQLMELDISTLPFSRRSSRSDSESSQSSSNNRDTNDSPNTAGTGRFNGCQRSPNLYNSVGASTGCAAAASWMSSSYPRTSYSHMGVSHAARVHTSNSDTIYHVQERLQELVEEHCVSPSYKSCDGDGLGVAEDKATPLVKQRIDHASQVPLSPPPTGHTSLLSGLSSRFPGGERITMRRVSVCSRKGLVGNVKVCSESSDGSATVEMGSQDQSHDQAVHPLPTYPSPLFLLDQFVTCGEVLHRGGLDTVVLTEQEGIDWNHFGGCPHSEEFRIMQSQVVLLHSQMLFERHQCLQHARRNRRLLSKARSATHVAQELLSLRDQLHQQEALVSSLQEQLRRVSEEHEARQLSHQGMEGHIIHECVSLKEDNARLQQELQQSRKKNSQIDESLWAANRRIFALENERQLTKPHLQRASELQMEVTGLTTQLHVLGELYRQQSNELVSLQTLSQREAEWKSTIAALTKEKGEEAREVLCLRQQLGAYQYRLRELEEEGKRWEAELEKMRIQWEEESGRERTKIETLEEKYGSMKVIGQQLESHMLELKGCCPVHREKAHIRHCHNHSSTSLTNTPSPSNVATI